MGHHITVVVVDMTNCLFSKILSVRFKGKLRKMISNKMIIIADKSLPMRTEGNLKHSHTKYTNLKNS